MQLQWKKDQNLGLWISLKYAKYEAAFPGKLHAATAEEVEEAKGDTTVALQNIKDDNRNVSDILQIQLTYF